MMRAIGLRSRALGATKRSSDLDLAIDLGRVLDRKERTQLVLAFEDSDLPYESRHYRSAQRGCVFQANHRKRSGRTAGF